MGFVPARSYRVVPARNRSTGGGNRKGAALTMRYVSAIVSGGAVCVVCLLLANRLLAVDLLDAFPFAVCVGVLVTAGQLDDKKE